MTQHNTTPKFDCIDFNEDSPEGLAYAYGWDYFGNCFYGLVEIDNEEIIGEPVHWVTLPYRFGITDDNVSIYRKQFLENYIETTNKVA